MADQAIFKSVYRGRQSALHHAAYMRMAKVLLALEALKRAGISLHEKSVFDYGFGAGTFYRYCPTSARLAGVEMDAENVAAVEAELRRRNHRAVRLDSIDIEHWEEHPLLQSTYDIFLCSHVLEHLPDPAAFLRRIRQCLKPDGAFVGLVPINERRANPHHIQVCDAPTIRGWLDQAGMAARVYLEGDPWLYWAQPLFTSDAGARHKLAQAVSLGIGIPSVLLGPRFWPALSGVFGRLTLSKPTQAAFVANRLE